MPARRREYPATKATGTPPPQYSHAHCIATARVMEPRRERTMNRRESLARAVMALLCSAALSACGNPAAPTCTDQYGRGETQFNTLSVQCNPVGTVLVCQATASITGLYVYCPKSEDVTQFAVWTVGDSAILHVDSPGRFSAVAVGDSLVHASWQSITIGGTRAVSVFPGTGPLPTFEVSGLVYQSGQTQSAGAINGAVVEILDGLVAGRSVTSGVPPPLLPGYAGPVGGAGYYRLLGVPSGRYTLRVSKAGYVTQERQLTVGPNGSTSADFDLALQPG